MTPALAALVGFASWQLLLALGILLFRVEHVHRGRLGLADLRVDVPHGTERYRRLCRAHANCAENLPVFAVVVVVDFLLGGSRVVAVAAPLVLAARIGQSVTHIASGSSRAVALRGAFFFVQSFTLAMLGLWLLFAR